MLKHDIKPTDVPCYIENAIKEYNRKSNMGNKNAENIYQNNIDKKDIDTGKGSGSR